MDGRFSAQCSLSTAVASTERGSARQPSRGHPKEKGKKMKKMKNEKKKKRKKTKKNKEKQIRNYLRADAHALEGRLGTAWEAWEAWEAWNGLERLGTACRVLEGLGRSWKVLGILAQLKGGPHCGLAVLAPARTSLPVHTYPCYGLCRAEVRFLWMAVL